MTKHICTYCPKVKICDWKCKPECERKAKKQVKLDERYNSLIPNGIPKYIRCYDAGEEVGDRYTIVFTGNFKDRKGRCYYLGCSENPFHPQGIGQHGESDTMIDQPSYKHLGKKVKFETLPEKVKIAVMNDYKDYWEI